MPEVPVQLASITVERRNRCRVRPAEGESAATLWEEVTKALRVTQVTLERKLYRFRTETFRRTLDRALKPLEEQRDSALGFGGWSFVSLPPESLARRGFVYDSTGGPVFVAPDIQVLLSDPFLESHCFKVQSPAGNDTALVGLAFEPVPRPQRRDIAGVLWLDRRTAELRVVEYHYTNLDPWMPGARAGRRGRHLGQAPSSPKSEIRLRLLTRGREPIDAGWWGGRIAARAARRAGIAATAYRIVHAEGDGLPSLVVDRYGPYVVAQLLSAGIEQARADVVAGIRTALAPAGLLLRNDVAIRRHEGLPLEVVPVFGTVPDAVEVEEDGIRYLAAPRTGQKTGAFLDQRENRALVARHAGPGRALDLFAYHGSFALHLARRATTVTAVDSSGEALARGAENASLNGLANITWREAHAFDLARELERRDETSDTVVLDPPAFAKTKQSVPRALAGYKEINLRAMRLLSSGGVLFTCSCSYHVNRAVFAEMLADAARDSGRRLELVALTGAGRDHPELVNVPETGYLKGVLLRAVD